MNSCPHHVVEQIKFNKSEEKIISKVVVPDKLLKYGSEVNSGAHVKDESSMDYLLKTLHYILRTLSGPEESVTAESKTIGNLFRIDDEVNCSLKDRETYKLCPFLPVSHASMTKQLTRNPEVEGIHTEILNLLVDHESEVNSEISCGKDSELYMLLAASKVLFQFGNDVNLRQEGYGDENTSTIGRCAFLDWLMVPGSEVNNVNEPDSSWMQNGLKMKLRVLVNRLITSGNDVNLNSDVFRES